MECKFYPKLIGTVSEWLSTNELQKSHCRFRKIFYVWLVLYYILLKRSIDTLYSDLKEID